MGIAILGDVLTEWSKYELDDSIYLPDGAEPALDLPVNVLSFDATRKRSFEGQQYLLGIEQVRDAVEGLKSQLGRTPTPSECLRAVIHFARHDAFIDPRDAKDE
jgi:hypothetical protein